MPVAVPSMGLVHFSMLEELTHTSLEFNRADTMHAWAHTMEQVGLVEIKQLPQNECRVDITSSGRLLAKQASRLLEAWTSQMAGQAGKTTADLRDALTKAQGAVSLGAFEEFLPK